MNTINLELYENICKADIQNSIYISTKILLTENKNNDFNFLVLQSTLISACSYIGSFISIFEIHLWLDTVDSIISVIDDQQIDIKNIYILITKLCILCQNYNKKSTTKTGMLSVKVVREKIIDMFDINSKLSDAGITKFSCILPPYDSPSYNIAIQILTGYTNIFKQISTLSSDSDADKLSDLSNKIRHSFDYIIRKKYTFETSFYENDSDAVWFLWGIISILYQDRDIDIIYRLFCFEYKKNIKKYRIGLLWGCALAMVFIEKKDVSRKWNNEELNMLNKIYEVSIDLFKDIKKSIQDTMIKESCDIEQSESIAYNGVDYLSNYRPVLNTTTQNGYDIIDYPSTTEDNIKRIKYKK